MEVAHPGASYNPTYEDHQELLAKAVAFHLRERDKEKKLARFSRMEKGVRILLIVTQYLQAFLR